MTAARRIAAGACEITAAGFVLLGVAAVLVAVALADLAGVARGGIGVAAR